tara:strand:+ start:504 stop:698 length:195 start_codon:yes stop_codon:yes gene_type:complete
LPFNFVDLELVLPNYLPKYLFYHIHSGLLSTEPVFEGGQLSVKLAIDESFSPCLDNNQSHIRLA